MDALSRSALIISLCILFSILLTTVIVCLLRRFRVCCFQKSTVHVAPTHQNVATVYAIDSSDSSRISERIVPAKSAPLIAPRYQYLKVDVKSAAEERSLQKVQLDEAEDKWD